MSSTRPDGGDDAYIWDIRQVCADISALIAGMTFADYEAARTTQMAVERGLEIIGEASRRLSQTFRDAYSDVRWSSIIGLRNTLAHDYVHISNARIWEVIRYELPRLSQRLAETQQ